MSVLPLAEKALMPHVLQSLTDNPKSSFKEVYHKTKTFQVDKEGAWYEDDYVCNVKPFPARRFQKMMRKASFERAYPDLASNDVEGKILVFRYAQGRISNSQKVDVHLRIWINCNYFESV